MVFLSALLVQLGKLSRQEDVVVGTVSSGRVHADTERMVGMFVNTLALRMYPEEGKTYRGFLREVKERFLKAYENQEYPFEELVEELGIVRDASRNPLFDVMFTMSSMEGGGLETEGWSGQEIAKFDLTLDVSREGSCYRMVLEYCTALFKKESVCIMLEQYEQILRELLEDPDVYLGSIPSSPVKS